jgi:Transmembrane domain of unknown function (DUF3566)
MRTYPPYGDNLEGKRSEEDGVEQRAEPPSWLPDSGHPRTGAAADLRNPEADEATAGTTDGDTGYNFSGSMSYPDSQDTTFGQTGTTAGGYSYDPDPAADATSAIPPYPASLTEPAGSTSSPGSPGPGSPGPGSSSPGSSSAGRAVPPTSPGPADGPPAVKDDGRNRTTTFSVPRGRFKGGSRSPGTAAGSGAMGGAAASARPGTQARRADLVVSRLEPWSVVKFSFLMSLVAWVVLFVAVAFLYFVLSSLGVFTSIQHTLTSVTSSSGSSGTQLSHWFSASRVLGYTMLLGAVNIVLITALSTVGAMIYNLVAPLGGGIEVTLRETD